MSIRDLSGKRLVRHSDSLSTVASFSINGLTGTGPAHRYGFIIRANTKPILILGCDLRIFGGHNMVVRQFGISTLTEFNKQGVPTKYGNYTGTTPFLPSECVRGGALGNADINLADVASIVPPEMPATLPVLSRRFAAQAGTYRTGGYLVQPNTIVAFAVYMNNVPIQHVNGAGISVEGCIEYIEGDYDYSEFLKNGMAPLSY